MTSETKRERMAEEHWQSIRGELTHGESFKAGWDAGYYERDGEVMDLKIALAEYQQRLAESERERERLESLQKFSDDRIERDKWRVGELKRWRSLAEELGEALELLFTNEQINGGNEFSSLGLGHLRRYIDARKTLTKFLELKEESR